jgi:hypothetical protein
MIFFYFKILIISNYSNYKKDIHKISLLKAFYENYAYLLFFDSYLCFKLYYVDEKY